MIILYTVFTRVQHHPSLCRKYLFRSPFTEKSKSNGHAPKGFFERGTGKRREQKKETGSVMLQTNRFIPSIPRKRMRNSEDDRPRYFLACCPKSAPAVRLYVDEADFKQPHVPSLPLAHALKGNHFLFGG